MSDFEASGQDTPEPTSPSSLRPGLAHSRSHSGAARRQIVRAVKKITDALDKKNTYAYKNISYDKEIRVLKIFPGAKGSKLLCCLVPCPLLDQSVQPTSNPNNLIPYAALSYFWGEDEPRNVVYMFDTEAAYEEWKEKDPNGVLLRPVAAHILPVVAHVLIRDNLKDALEQLRSRDTTVTVWADALCINQNNVKERTAQVARMHDVYTQAMKVHIWLGEGNSEENKKTFAFLRKILDLQQLEKLVQRLETKGDDDTWKEDRKDCKRTIDLMRAKWFSRRWVIQELALATNAHVRRGNEEMSWLEFADAIALFMTKYDHIRRAFGGPLEYSALRESNDHHIFLLDARGLGANALVTATSDLFRRSNEGKILQRLLSLESLVSSMLLAFEASDPKDTIFAVLQIAKDVPELEQQSQSSPRKVATHSQYLVPLLGIAFWKFKVYTVLPSRPNEVQTSDISLRYTALSPRDSVIRFIDYCILALIVLLVWLLFRMLFEIANKMFAHVTKSGSRVQTAVDERIEANYRKCLRDVCADFIEYCIERSKSLDILCRHWAPLPKPSSDNEMVDMPSWILPITGHAFGGPQQSQRGRVNGDSFVGGSERTRPYTASGNIPPSFKFGKRNAAREASTEKIGQEPGEYTSLTPAQKRELPPRFDGTLKVKGIRLGVIRQTAPIAGGVISRVALELCGWSKGKGTSDMDQVWRILVANRGPNGMNPPNWYRRACKACLDWYDAGPDDVFNTRELRDIAGTPAGKVEFLDRVQQVVWNRNIISIRGPAGGEFIGIAPQQSQKSDVICIFFGCSVPVVLQPQDNGDFKFVGECYVHGVMDGEAVDPIPSETKEEWFKLV